MKSTRREVLKRGAAAGAALALGGCAALPRRGGGGASSDVVLTNGNFITMNPVQPRAASVFIRDGRFLTVGGSAPPSAAAQVIDVGGRTVIPGLNDSHLHLIRGGLNYNMELRWDGVPSLADAMRLLRAQVARTPPPQWVRVVGGFCEFQFAERRLPTLAELNEAAPDTPVFILHLYDRALLNRAALRAIGYTRDTPEPPGGSIERDHSGQPTGLLVAKPNATILYKTLALGPRLDPNDQLISTRHFMRELNRLGVTSCADAGGGFQNYPDDYAIIEKLHRDDQLSVRIAYSLFTQKPREERSDFARWANNVRPGQGDSLYRVNGAGEMLVYSAADFEDFREPRPDLPASLEADLDGVLRLLAEKRWPFRLHATYDESITRFLNVIESVHRDTPVNAQHWFIDHAETISDRNIERIKALGGGIAIQHRMAFQGEYFVERYGRDAARRSPPIRKMLEMALPVGGGTDATRVASFNPWTCLYWLTTGKTLGGLALYDETNRLTREEALALWTRGSAWFSNEDTQKGQIIAGQLADLAVLSEDYLSAPDDRLRGIESLLTIVGGRVVYAAAPFQHLAPPPLPVSPDWSPALPPAAPPAAPNEPLLCGGCSCFVA